MYMTVKQAAERWQVTTKTVRRWIEKGAVTAHRPCAASRKLLIRREDYTDSNKSEQKGT